MSVTSGARPLARPRSPSLTLASRFGRRPGRARERRWPTTSSCSTRPTTTGAIVRILLDRPDARNAQNRGLLVELDEAFLRAEADDTCRVVILGGTGKMFSSGHDMGSKVGDGGVRRPTRPSHDQRRHPRRAPRS